MSNFTQQIWSFIKPEFNLGWVIAILTLAFWLIEHISKSVPQIEVIKSRIYIPLAKKYKYRRLIKAALKADIEGHLNVVVSKLQNELPLGWIKSAKIEWVMKQNKDEFLDEEEVILRIRPIEDQDQNFLNAIYFFFKKTIFPRTRNVIPEIPRESVILHICRRVVEEQKSYLKSKFEDQFLEKVISKKKGVLSYLEKYKFLDEKGFFTGAFIREIHEVATNIRFNNLRYSIGSEIAAVLDHLEDFIKRLNVEKNKIPPDGWYKKAKVTNYGLLLVARPISIYTNPYTGRAKEHFDKEIERLYILGTEQEKRFVENVISAISGSGYWRLFEKFNLYKDYRGEKGGVGALFIKINKE